MRPHPPSLFDFEQQLIDMVERIAFDFEASVGIVIIEQAVRHGRETVEALGLAAPDGGLDQIEALARERLDAMTRTAPAAAGHKSSEHMADL